MSKNEQAASTTLDTQENAPAWNIRFYQGGDIPSLVALQNAAAVADGSEAVMTEEGLAASYAQPLSEPERQVFIAEGPHDDVPDGAALGAARAICFDDPNGNERLYQMRVTVHPAVRNKGLEQALAARMMDNIRANEQTPGMQPRDKISLLTITREKSASERALLEQLGLQVIRYAWTMRRPLDMPVTEPKEIEGVVVRNYRKPDDNAAMLDAYNSSFIDHFEFHALTQEMVDYKMAQDEMRGDLSWVAEIEEEPARLAGFCITEVDEAANTAAGKKEGWITLLGTVRRWRGKGLGKTLLLRGLHSLKEAGLEYALLGVDADSPTGANRLYESVGFTVDYQELLYKCDLKDAKL
ncbi:MAG: GNAT family N-acetyltransferase [Chloroflexota bacterium]